MVIFAITRNGYLELEPIIKLAKYAIWVSEGVLDNSEMDQLRESGVELTNFTYEIAPNDRGAIENALEDIALHHPGERIWVECQPQI